MPPEPTFIETCVNFVLVGCIFAGGMCAVFIPRRVDPAKVRAEGDKAIVGMMSSPWLPKRVLTPVGQKLWLARNIFWGVALVLLIVSINLR